ncbi:MAG: hypothetical protein N3A58_06000 [Spirochaetes bacterium]|nr:hypothetical protein [Spirochaetota bacterium]
MKTLKYIYKNYLNKLKNSKTFFYFFFSLLSAFLLNLSVTSDTNLILFFNIPLFLIYYTYIIKKDKYLFNISLILFSLTGGTFYFSWMNIYSKIIYPIATFVLFLYYFISFHFDYIINIKYLNKIFKNKFFFPAFPFIWLILLFILDQTKIGAFLYTWAYFFPLSSPYIQFIGVYGVTFIIILFSQLIISFYFSKSKKGVFISIFIYIIFILSSIFYSLYLNDLILEKTFMRKKDNYAKIKFALIQGNFRESWEHRKNHVLYILDSYLKLTEEAYFNEKFDMAIWPEYAIPGDVINDERLKIPISNLCKKLNISILLGCSPWVFNHPVYQNYNAALLFSNEGKIEHTYYSVNPLPFDYDVKPGEKYTVFNYKGLKFAVLMCYEEVFDRISKLFIKNFNIDFFVVLTNHALFDHLKGAYQTTLLSRIHAANYRRYILRATNSGYTMIISPSGKIISEIPLRKQTYLIQELIFKK